MAIPAGPKYGVISSLAKSSTLQDSENAPPTSIARRSKPTTTRKARSKKRGSICKSRSSRRKNSTGSVQDLVILALRVSDRRSAGVSLPGVQTARSHATEVLKQDAKIESVRH